LLTALREIIRANHDTFPVVQLEKEMASKGKNLSFGPEEISDLLDMEYGDRRVFPLLSLLYPFVDTSQLHHIDHFYPRSRLQQQRLERTGCDSVYAAQCVGLRDQLPNLMLLSGPLNNGKSDVLPLDWMKEAYPDDDQCKAAAERNDVPKSKSPPTELIIPSSPKEFVAFFEGRKEKMRGRIATLLV
jgi:hypothetical protein